MKKNLTLFALFVSNVFILSAQDYSKMNFTLVKKIIDMTEPARPAALFVEGDINFIRTQTEKLGGRFKYSAGDIAAIVLPISKVMELASYPQIIRMEDNYMKLQPMNDSMVVKNRIVAANNGDAPLPQGYDGTGVVLGFIDTGIDYSHPDYKDSAGNTRIKYIWDHELPDSANTPLPYNYGQEFTSAMIDAGQASAHMDDFPYTPGHGTHVTGVAAGNGLAINHFAGVAPKADIIMVAANFYMNDDDWLNSVADAVKYIYDKADLMGEPCVINISAGVVLGSHDAKDSQAMLISNLISAQNGRALVCAAGNYGNIPLHLQHNVASPDTVFTWFKYNANLGNSILINMWATPSSFTAMRFTIGIDKVSPYYEFRAMLPYSTISQHLVLKTDTLKNSSGQRLALIQSFGQLTGGRYSMVFNILPDSTTGYYFRLMSTATGIFDVWNYYPPYDNIISTGLPPDTIFPDITKYALPDLTQNIVSSFTCSDKVIAVGNYINKSSYMACDSTFLNGTDIPNALAANSSIGPTRDGRIKPDITASGTITFAPVRIAAYAGPPNPVTLALGCMHLRDGGTSTASPVVAGIGALFFQRFPNANWFDFKQAVTLCAYTDSFSLSVGPVPNNTWGYGKVDGFQTIIPCAAVGIHETETLTNDNFYVSPNPFNDHASVHYDFSGTKSKRGEIKIFDAIGNEVRKISVSKITGEIILKKQDFRSGVYFISMVSDSQVITTKKLVIL